MQVLSSDDDFGLPIWPGNVGSSYDSTEYHQRFVRVNPWANTGTTLGSGAATSPGVASAANGLHYLSNGISATTPIACEFCGRRDGASALVRSMMWLDDYAAPYAQDDLNITWTFALDTTGGQASFSSSGAPATGSLAKSQPSTGGASGSGSAKSTLTGKMIVAPQGLVSHAPGATPDTPGPEITPTGWRGTLVGFRINGSHVDASALPLTFDAGMHESVDGYWLWIDTGGTDPLDPNADLDIRLYSTHAANQTATGVTRRLIARQYLIAGVGHMDLANPFTVRVEVENVTGDPNIRVYLGPWDGLAETQMFVSTLPGTVEEPVSPNATVSSGTVIDSDATYKKTGQGTIAFGGFPDRTDTFGQGGSTVDVREGLVSFEARRLSTNVVAMRDEFVRVATPTNIPPLGGAMFGVTDKFGNQGSSLEAMWWGGENAETGHFSGQITRTLVRAATGATTYDPLAYAISDPEGTTVPPAVAGSDNRTDVVSLRPADQDNSQHRRITFRVGAQNTANINYAAQAFVFGLGLFGDTSAGVLTTCIEARILMTTTALGAQDTVIVSILGRVATQPANTFPQVFRILQQTLSSPPNLLDGADHTLEFDCHIFENASGPNAPLVYQVKLDGTAVEWVADDIENGANVTLIAGGEAIDFAPLKSKGSVEAVTWWSATPETDITGTKLWDPWRIHTWEQLTLTTGASGIDPDDQVGIAIGGEGTAVGDLHNVLTEDFEITEEVYRPGRLTRFESGHTTGTPLWKTGRSVYKFAAVGVTATEEAALRTFWDDHDGLETPFSWTQDGESAITAAFIPDTLQVDEIGPLVYAVRFEIIELVVA